MFFSSNKKKINKKKIKKKRIITKILEQIIDVHFLKSMHTHTLPKKKKIEELRHTHIHTQKKRLQISDV